MTYTNVTRTRNTDADTAETAPAPKTNWTAKKRDPGHHVKHDADGTMQLGKDKAVLLLSLSIPAGEGSRYVRMNIDDPTAKKDMSAKRTGDSHESRQVIMSQRGMLIPELIAELLETGYEITDGSYKEMYDSKTDRRMGDKITLVFIWPGTPDQENVNAVPPTAEQLLALQEVCKIAFTKCVVWDNGNISTINLSAPQPERKKPAPSLHVRFGTLLVEEAPAPQRKSDTPGD